MSINSGRARIGDRFVLTSDGVHGDGQPRRLGALAAQAARPKRLAAAGRGGAGCRQQGQTITALVLIVQGLDAARQLSDARRRLHPLTPLPPLPPAASARRSTSSPSAALAADAGAHRIYRARDAQRRRRSDLKTPHRDRARPTPRSAPALAHLEGGSRLASC